MSEKVTIWWTCLIIATFFWSIALVGHLSGTPMKFVIINAACGCIGFIAWGIYELVVHKQERRLQRWINQRQAWEEAE